MNNLNPKVYYMIHNYRGKIKKKKKNCLVYVVKFLIKFQIKEITTGLRPLGMHFVFGHYLNR